LFAKAKITPYICINKKKDNKQLNFTIMKASENLIKALNCMLAQEVVSINLDYLKLFYNGSEQQYAENFAKNIVINSIDNDGSISLYSHEKDDFVNGIDVEQIIF
jgi:hypothetical protein